MSIYTRALEAADIGDDRTVLTLLKDLGNASADVQKAVVMVNRALESPSCIYNKDASSTPWSVAELAALIYFLRVGKKFVEVGYGPNKGDPPAIVIVLSRSNKPPHYAVFPCDGKKIFPVLDKLTRAVTRGAADTRSEAAAAADATEEYTSASK